MDPTIRFVTLENIARFVDKIEKSDCPEQQALLRRLLVDQENLSAYRAERLDIADRHIARATDRIAVLERELDQNRASGRDTAFLESRLRYMRVFLNHVIDMRRIWADTMDMMAIREGMDMAHDQDPPRPGKIRS